ncbi:MAG: M15 family metallopeptidase [Candidatus Parcubacteria bacterium]|nr:M15 family metallopeptidase [Candidatus Parcubacteria bacterium]
MASLKLLKQYLTNRYYIMGAVFLFCLLLSSTISWGYFNDKDASTINNTNEIIPPPIPLPTEINPNFIKQANGCFIPTAAIYGYSLRITSGFRTIAEQDEIYNQGRITQGDIVTDAPGGKSIHNYGFAVDIVDRDHEYDINWTRLRKIAAYCGLEPGDETDIPHFEYRGGLTTDDFIAGKKPNPLTLPCSIMEERANANQPLKLKDLQNCGAPKF